MVAAYVGLGSNLEEPPEQIARALRALAQFPHTRLAARSRLYRTVPWGGITQPDFVNAVALLETELEPAQLMRALLALERDAGRSRDEVRYGPRILDLDLLLYGDRQINAGGLAVPHPRLTERAFVLVPLHEIAPMLDIPGQGKVERLLAAVDRAGVVPL